MQIAPTTTTYQSSNNGWADPVGVDYNKTVTLDLSAFTKGTHYPDGFLKSGLPIAKISASGLYGPYDDTAADGRQTLTGFLYGDRSINGDADVIAPMYRQGVVVTSRLPIAVDAAGKADVAAHIFFD